MSIELRIADRRKQLNVTQQQLAERIGKEQKYISKLERGIGNPTAETLILLSEALDASIDWLLGLTALPERRTQLPADLDEMEREVVVILRSKSLERQKELIELLRLAK